MKKQYLFLLLIFIIPFQLFCEGFSLSGKVLDDETMQGLVGVTIQVFSGEKPISENLIEGVISKKEGYFVFNSGVKGPITITASMVGYKKFEEHINLDENITIIIYLTMSSFKTDEIIVTANQRIQNIQEISNSAVVLGRNELNLTSRSDFEQALKDVPGVEVYDENISIRGSDGFDFGIGSRTLMMLDGIPLMSGDQGDAKFDLIPNSEISRVEIVKGSGSALYGSSAIGGVINLISSDENDHILEHNYLSGDFSIEFGEYSKHKYKTWQYKDSDFPKKDYEGSIRFYTKNFGISLAGDYDYDLSYRVFDDNKRWSVYSKLYYNPEPNHKINLILLHQENSSADWVYWNSLDSATYPPTGTDLNGRLFSNKSMLAFNLQFPFVNDFSEGFYSLKWSLFHTDFHNNVAKTNDDYRESQTMARYADFQFTLPAFSNAVLTSGISWYGNLVNSASFGDRKQDIFALYSQMEFKPIDKLTMTFGGRFDVELAAKDNINQEFSPKFGLNFKLSEQISVRGSIGKGFRAPSVAERYAAINYQGFKVIENLDLKPETSWNFEFGGNAKFNSLIIPMEFEGTFFWNTYKDLIEPGFLDENYSLIKFQNITNARIPGLELTCRTLISGNLVFSNSFTYIDPVDTDLNEVLKFRSRYYYNSSILLQYDLDKPSIEINYPLSPSDYYYQNISFDIKVNYRYSSKVEEIDNKLVLQVKDAQSRVPIHVVDLYAGINFEPSSSFNPANSIKATIGLNVYNLLNHYYTYMVGNLAPTRFIGLSMSLSY